MLSTNDNDVVTNTNRGTPMGELFRRFWLPVALASELPGPDCEPVRIKVLNEQMIAFRDTSGRPGVVDAFCPHRGAPMFFGRNEEDGLRCIYHGWKFDVTGRCVDLPSAPEGDTYMNKVTIKAYPVIEAGNLIWAYMGPADKQPPFPEFEWTRMPLENVYVSKFRLECNYLQAMEGDYDVSHAAFLHSNMSDASIDNSLDPNQLSMLSSGIRDPNDPFPRAVGTRRVRRGSLIAGMAGEIEDSDSGALFIMPIDQGEKKTAMVMPWMMPIFCTAGIAGPNTYSSNMRIPIDNESLMFFRLRWSYDTIPERDIQEYRDGEWFYPQLIPGTWQTRDNVENDYNLDRQKQRSETYSGIRTFPLQDIAMMENQWGPLADRTQEHLTSMDNQIIYVRRRLLKTAKALADGVEPAEPWHPEAYRYHVEMVTTANMEESIAEARQKAVESRVDEAKKVAPKISA